MPFDQVRRRAMGIRRKDVAPFDPLVLLLGLFARSLFPAPRSARHRHHRSQTRFEYLKLPHHYRDDLDSGELLLLGGPERRGRDIELGDALYARARCRCTFRRSRPTAGAG